MPLPNHALVLVADGTKVLFLRNNGDENQIDLRTEAHDEREDRKDRDIKTDAPGTQGQSAGYGRPAMDETDFHQQEEDRWIDEAAEELKRRALRNDFDALAIVAPPQGPRAPSQEASQGSGEAGRLHRQQRDERSAYP